MEKEKDEIMETLTRHLDGKKTTRANLLALADHLSGTNKSLSPIKNSDSDEEFDAFDEFPIINYYDDGSMNIMNMIQNNS